MTATEIREALAEVDRDAWGPTTAARLIEAARAYADLLDNEVFFQHMADLLNTHLDHLQAFSSLEPDLPIHFGPVAMRTMVEQALALAGGESP